MFEDISGDAAVNDITEIESLCMHCFKKGTTKMLLTRIPFYREVIISSFECGECGEKNNELQSAQTIQDQGIKFTLNLEKVADLNRTVVRSEHAVISVPELDLEIPATTKRAEITTVEGVLSRTVSDLEMGQSERRLADTDTADRVDEFLDRIRSVLSLHTPATLVVEDPAGNSHVENPYAPSSDPALTVLKYKRSAEQNQQLGVVAATYENEEQTSDKPAKVEASDNFDEIPGALDEVVSFNTNCSNCQRPCVTNMKLTNIPYFKEVVIMATVCEHCGHRTNEVKSSGPVSEKGVRMILKIKSVLDLNRDLLKSDTCAVFIPELDIQVGSAAISGRFTTVEGLLISIKEGLENNPLLMGDSSSEDRREKLAQICARIQRVIDLEDEATMVLDDPAGNSYLQDLYIPEPDPFLSVEKYERTYEDNEMLGLNDLITENYETPESAATGSNDKEPGSSDDSVSDSKASKDPATGSETAKVAVSDSKISEDPASDFKTSENYVSESKTSKNISSGSETAEDPASDSKTDEDPASDSKTSEDPASYSKTSKHPANGS